MRKYRTSLALLSLIVLAIVANSDAETSFQQFYKQQNEAYAKYRAALFQTNKNDREASLKATAQFLQQWDAIVQQYAASPPEIFAADSTWKATLEKITEIAVKGKTEIEAGDLAEAHETLEAIRDEFTELRRKNHVVVFSDHMNTYHEVMEHLLLAGYSPTKLDAAALNSIREQLAVLEFLAEQIKLNAPQEYRSNEAYQKLENGLFASVKSLREALENNEPQEIIKAIQNLKPPYAKLFLNFG
jgi:hypothetical protein